MTRVGKQTRNVRLRTGREDAARHFVDDGCVAADARKVCGAAGAETAGEAGLLSFLFSVETFLRGMDTHSTLGDIGDALAHGGGAERSDGGEAEETHGGRWIGGGIWRVEL